MKIVSASQLPIQSQSSTKRSRGDLPAPVSPNTVAAVVEAKPAERIVVSADKAQSGYGPPNTYSGFSNNAEQKAIDLYQVTAAISYQGGDGDLIGVDTFA